MNHDYKQLETFLNNFNQSKIVDNNNKPDGNLFEIAGYPHYENVVSNILAFFFDSEEQHNFKDRWIKALINCYLRKYPREDINSDSIITNNIEREYSNGSDKRIDLLVDCSSFLVVIENKIYAELYNDLNIYTEMANNYLKANDNEGMPLVKIVLSLFEVKNIKPKDYINITYEELFAELEKEKDIYHQNNKWQIYSEEFIEAIKRRKTNMKINEEWIKFANKNVDGFNAFVKAYKEDCRVRLKFCKELNKAIKSIDDSLYCGTYEGGQNDPYYSVYLNMKLSDEATVCIETYIMKQPSTKLYEEYSKIYVALWARDHRPYQRFDELVEAMGVSKAIEHTTDGWKEQRILQIVDIESANVNNLALGIVDYAHRIMNK